MKFPCRILLVLGTVATAWAQLTSCPNPEQNFLDDLFCWDRLKPLAKYRPIDGQLKNQCVHPAATNAPYSHLAGIFFEDCDWKIRASVDGSPLPSPRNIVNSIFREHKRQLSTNFTAPSILCTFMAQIYAHDMGSMTNNPNALEIRAGCCLNQRIVEPTHPDCGLIPIYPNDPDFGETLPNVNCLFVPRTKTVEGSGDPTLTQNTVTAFLDASMVYGSTEADLASIREYSGGRLKTDELNILPKNAAGAYFIGDSRVMQTPQLAIAHSIWLREHNRLAGILGAMNPAWDDEKLFQETRRIVIAEYQNIVYNQFLPAFYHPSIVALLDVPDVSAIVGGSTYAEMNQAIFRSFHGLIPKNVTFLDADGVETSWRFHDMLLNNQPVLEEHYEDIVRGMMRQPANVENYENALFSKLFTNSPTNPGFDILSVDITRGRDHGVPPYAHILKYVKGRPITSFRDLETHIDPAIVRKLEGEYRSVHDVDLLVGALLETPMEGTLWGPTIQLISLKQFTLAKTSDPYFYTHVLTNPKPFTAAQLKEIKKFDSNYLYCLNTSIGKVPYKASMPAKAPEDYIDCSSLVPLSYDSWRE